jgi:hypothetical protein
MSDDNSNNNNETRSRSRARIEDLQEIRQAEVLGLYSKGLSQSQITHNHLIHILRVRQQ